MIKFNYEIPANSKMFMEQYIQFIEFKILNPEGLIQIKYPKFTFKRLIDASKASALIIYSADEDKSMFNELFIFIFFACVALVILILALVTALCFYRTRITPLIMEKLKATKDKFFFNGAIRSYQISFIKLGIAASI